MNTEVRIKLQYVLLMQQSKLEYIWKCIVFWFFLFYASAFHGSALNIYLSVPCRLLGSCLSEIFFGVWPPSGPTNSYCISLL